MTLQKEKELFGNEEESHVGKGGKNCYYAMGID